MTICTKGVLREMRMLPSKTCRHCSGKAVLMPILPAASMRILSVPLVQNLTGKPFDDPNLLAFPDKTFPVRLHVSAPMEGVPGSTLSGPIWASKRSVSDTKSITAITIIDFFLMFQLF